MTALTRKTPIAAIYLQRETAYYTWLGSIRIIFVRTQPNRDTTQQAFWGLHTLVYHDDSLEMWVNYFSCSASPASSSPLIPWLLAIINDHLSCLVAFFPLPERDFCLRRPMPICLPTTPFPSDFLRTFHSQNPRHVSRLIRSTVSPLSTHKHVPK
jgi:hypothetical protein